MITLDELRSLRVFATLPDDALRRVASAVDDIPLIAGEYFAHEGDAPSLFIVVEGEAEITKVTGGEERVIGRRTPGQFFGEVPITLAAPFPASGRAAVDSRIIRLDPSSYYSVAAIVPTLAAKVGGLARRYLESLQEMAADRPVPDVRIEGIRRHPTTRAVVAFLTRNQVPFDLDVRDAADAAEDSPVVTLAAGGRLTAPSLRDLAVAVGLAVQPRHAAYDVVILGAGPAGLTAAVNAAAEGLSTLVVESTAPGGQAGTSSRIENYTGFPYGISGDDLAARALTQARRLGAEIVVTRTVERLEVDAAGGRRRVVLDGDEAVTARAVMIATGVQWRTLPAPGVDRFLGNGVYYGAARSDAALAQGGDVVIIGAGNSAGQAALFFARRARTVTLLVRGSSLEASMSTYLIDQIGRVDRIRVELRSELVGCRGESALDAVDVRNGAGDVGSRPADVVFVMIGADAETAWLPASIARDARGFLLTGHDTEASWREERRPFALETSVPGVFAIGDVRAGSVKRVAAGVGEGGMAVAFVHQYLAL